MEDFRVVHADDAEIRVLHSASNFVYRLAVQDGALAPSDQVERYHELGMPEPEAAYCKGVILGIYRYERESKSEFREWPVDIAAECAGFLLDKRQERNRASVNAMHEFIHERCPEWAKWVKDKKGGS